MTASVKERVNPSAEFLHANKWKIFGVMMIGWAMSLLDISIVNVAVPELQRDLDTDLGSITWVVNGYNIAFAVLLVAMGRLADQFGRKRFFILGMAVFTIGSGLAALSWSADWLIVFRVIQGAGAGILAPLGFAMTVLVFPPQQRGLGLALIAVVALVSAALGPVVGGLLLEVASWEWIFLINIPFGIVGIVLCLRWWPESYDLTASRRVDVLGMALLAGAVFFLTFGLVEANPAAGEVALFVTLIQASVLLFVAFYFSQRRRPDAMITPGLAGNEQFLKANFAMMLFAAGALGSLLLLALVFINLWGYSPLEAGLALAPAPLFGLLVWPFVGRVADTKPPGQIARPALLLMGAGLLWISFLPSVSHSGWQYVQILPGIMMYGMGMGAVFPALNVGAMGAVQGQELGLASGILNTSRQLGAAVGVAILVATFGAAMHYHADWFREDDVEDLVDEYELPPPMVVGIVQRSVADYVGAASDRFDDGPGLDDDVIEITASSAREGFAWAFRQGALLALSALPLLGALRRTPAQARAEAQAAMAAAAAAAPPGAAPPASPSSAPEDDGRTDHAELEQKVDELESSLESLRAELNGPESTRAPQPD